MAGQVHGVQGRRRAADAGAVAHRHVDRGRPHAHVHRAPLARGGVPHERAAASRTSSTQLRARGIIAADAPAACRAITDRPVVRLRCCPGVAGWLAGIFLLVFIGIALQTRIEVSTIFVLGAVLLAAAWVTVLRRSPRRVPRPARARAVHRRADAPWPWSVLEDAASGLAHLPRRCWSLQLGVLLVMPNRTARTLAALFATIAWVYTMRFADASGQRRRRSSSTSGFGTSRAAEPGSRASPGCSPGCRCWLLHALADPAREPTGWQRRLRVFARPILTGPAAGLSLRRHRRRALHGGGRSAHESLGQGLSSWLGDFPAAVDRARAVRRLCARSACAATACRASPCSRRWCTSARFYYLYGTSLTVEVRDHGVSGRGAARRRHAGSRRRRGGRAMNPVAATPADRRRRAAGAAGASTSPSSPRNASRRSGERIYLAARARRSALADAGRLHGAALRARDAHSAGRQPAAPALLVAPERHRHATIRISRRPGCASATASATSRCGSAPMRTSSKKAPRSAMPARATASSA